GAPSAHERRQPPDRWRADWPGHAATLRLERLVRAGHRPDGLPVAEDQHGSECVGRFRSGTPLGAARERHPRRRFRGGGRWAGTWWPPAPRCGGRASSDKGPLWSAPLEETAPSADLHPIVMALWLGPWMAEGSGPQLNSTLAMQGNKRKNLE